MSLLISRMAVGRMAFVDGANDTKAMAKSFMVEIATIDLFAQAVPSASALMVYAVVG